MAILINNQLMKWDFLKINMSAQRYELLIRQSPIPSLLTWTSLALDKQMKFAVTGPMKGDKFDIGCKTIFPKYH